eukprot:273244-Pelagomonas_calceolata.AAC.6
MHGKWRELGGIHLLEHTHLHPLEHPGLVLHEGSTVTVGMSLFSAHTCWSSKHAIPAVPVLWIRYGMGQLYFRQEKYDVALVHFKSAALVNPQSSVLRCYWGMALAKQGILGNALAKLQSHRGVLRFVMLAVTSCGVALCYVGCCILRLPGAPVAASEWANEVIQNDYQA